MNAVPMLVAAANDPKSTVIRLDPARFVTIELAAVLTGLTAKAIRMKIAKGVWLEDRQFVRRDGRVLIDLEGYERWAASGQA